MTKQVATGQQWPRGGGEAGELVRNFDWSKTSLGPIEAWPAQLRSTVDTVVNSPIPKVLMWGRDHVMVYNDGYIAIAGGYSPRAQQKTVDVTRQVNGQVISGRVLTSDPILPGDTIFVRERLF